MGIIQSAINGRERAAYGPSLCSVILSEMEMPPAQNSYLVSVRVMLGGEGRRPARPVEWRRAVGR